MGDLMAKVISLRGRKKPEGTLSPEALVAACAAGDPEAVARLYDHYCDDVSRFLSRLAYVNQQDVEDLIQEVFLAVFRSAPRYSRRSSVRTWLFAIAANIARDTARKAIRYRGFKERLANEPKIAAIASPDSRSIDHALREKLSVQLLELPHDQRVAFVMCDIEEISGVEAARALGIPKGTLYRRLHEARKKLQDALRE